MEYKDGFVEGTLVHSKDGLKPIGEIKAGDFVLSHTEDPLKGTERGYKRVTRTVSFEDRQILQFCWTRNHGNGEFDDAFATPNPLVWSYPQGWLPIGKVPYTSSGGEEWFGRNLVMADGSGARGTRLTAFTQPRKEKSPTCIAMDSVPEITWICLCLHTDFSMRRRKVNTRPNVKIRTAMIG